MTVSVENWCAASENEVPEFTVASTLLASSIVGKIGQHQLAGVHIEQGDTIRIDSEQSSVILDGEVFEANNERPIFLRSTAPVPFLKLAA